MKVKKQHRKKKFLHKLNRKRMHQKQRSTGDVQWLVQFCYCFNNYEK